MRKQLAVFAVLAVAMALALTAPAALAAPASAGSGGRAAQARGKLKVVVQVDRFYMRGRRTLANGTLTTSLTQVGGQNTVLRSPVTLSASSGGSCSILNLNLNELTLNLLGLNVHLDKVVLTVTGKAHGGVLGSLFCKLAHARITGKRAAVQSLNAGLRSHPLTPLSFSVPIQQKVTAAQSPAPSCQVLTLILGPLNLNLLGLEVDLNKVNLVITAVRGQGALGDLFCQLSDH